MNKSTKIIGGTFAIIMVATLAVSSAMAYQGDYSKKGPAYSSERHNTMTEAMENNDYKAWSKLMADRGRVTRIINEENFAKFAEARRLAHSGDLEGADAIRKELGLRTRDGKKVGAGYGKGEKRGKMNNENRGQNKGGKFIDSNNDGICDNL
ncbi:MAG: hypothetical protein U9O55_01115 [Patescibacteria group bacterium]|nr:hypothetical protein [Patescibacteria group bacterium]